ncbi:hypothetical protein Pan153_19600 [Gimesia panareensis]|uniref:Uncharacterized protein n=1 Tax=Gimesia panareensis TaxID=2527978 RepID=A0A518FM17_9PLAN|nr:hypothetical protein [Gimesia panareensis]QDV17325.1 hypothetical protein Pan153_19600 [Gimesia panareensis]
MRVHWKRLCGSTLIALVVWICCIGLSALLGARLSYYTGKADEIPKWNG